MNCRQGAFSLAMDTGRVRAGDDLLDLFGLDPVEFDGRVETLLGLTVPEDLPSLMSVVEADHMSIGDRELEFRVLQPTGPPKWLRRALLPGGVGHSARLVGTVDDASTLRSDVTDVARVQRLATALATAVTVRDVGKAVVAALRRPLRADRIALAELESDRLVVTVLDPPEPESWPELWRREWRTEWPDAPVRAMPTLAAALREGRARIWPAGSALERGLSEVGPRRPRRLAAARREPHGRGLPDRLGHTARLRLRRTRPAHRLRRPRRTGPGRRPAPSTPNTNSSACSSASCCPAACPACREPRPSPAICPARRGWSSAATGTTSSRCPTTTSPSSSATSRATAPAPPPSWARCAPPCAPTPSKGTRRTWWSPTPTGCSWTWRATSSPPVPTSTSTWRRAPPGACAPGTCRRCCATLTARPRSRRPRAARTLGVITQADFPMSPLRLPPGTLIALVTDGLVETPDSDIDEGIERLADQLAALPPATWGSSPTPSSATPSAATTSPGPVLLLRYDGMDLRPLRESWTVWRVPQAVGHARRFARRTLRSWGVTEDFDAALLVVSELVTNALVHTDGQVRMDLTLINDRLRVAVADASPRSRGETDQHRLGGHRRPGRPPRRGLRRPGAHCRSAAASRCGRR
ncbi:hypothetical protein SPURM210S_00576 [Streptomyces purpurascens]